ncbi:glutamyl aminopeptidase [Pseudolactococcus insecticola]|uniref:Putative glutamyl-aminopeptidase n=1 Tax=Pseudolactococcus insecticola TaxID=2709158 RepID=A0A6A0B8A7_9LACT|nr:glutamyl aminopeptidase [Lactococcus insecticola]GFH41005.1 putative glutamyl-aminopeptidase [Lactococcus insecticola]
MTITFDKIKEITEIQATSGFEQPMRDFMRNKITPHVDHVETDGLGGIFGIKENADTNAPRIMVAAHMDEVGFMVSTIKPDGTLRVVPLGGWNPLVISAQRFTLFTRNGSKLPVITGGIPPHLLRAAGGTPAMPKVEDIIFDAGFADRAEAERYDVHPGAIIVPETQTILTANQKNVISKSWDNRYGCLMVTELLEHLTSTNTHLPNTLIAGANVQEEVGLRGAHVSTTKFDPELFFAVDCSPAQDTFDASADGHIGNGTLLRIFDPGHIMLPNMRDFLLDTAETAGVKYQYYVSKGGTDAGAAHLKNAGIPSTTIGVCARYIHSHQTLFSLEDFDTAQAFLREIVTTLDRGTVDEILKY